MRPGKRPERASSIRVQTTGAVRTFEITASTKGEAERILRRNHPKRGYEMTPMGAVEQPGGQFTFGLGYSADDEELLRSIARIATCYARHVGVNVDRSEAALRFARGEQVDRCPVGPPRGDVVQTLGMPEHPLYHAVFLGRVAPSAPLLAYVVLFQFCEFIVEFTGDYPEHRLPTGHYQSLVSGLVETHPFTWVLAAEDGTEWIRERKLAADRLVPLARNLAGV